jgi:hypothetical protein
MVQHWNGLQRYLVSNNTPNSSLIISLPTVLMQLIPLMHRIGGPNLFPSLIVAFVTGSSRVQNIPRAQNQMADSVAKSVFLHYAVI